MQKKQDEKYAEYQRFCIPDRRVKRIKYTLLIICFLMFLFHFWLAFPGFISPDTSRTLNLEKYGWHPIIIPYVLELLFKLFGTHVFLYLLLQLIPFYLGIFLIGLGILYHFKSPVKGIILLLLLPFISNIFFMNIWLSSSSLSPVWVFFFYALIFNRLMLDDLYRINLGYCVLLCTFFILALLSRHEAICQLWPCWLFLIFKTRGNIKKIVLFFISIFVSIFLSLELPKLFAEPSPYPPPDYHIMLFQIAEACVPDNDSSCFDSEWYSYKKSWKDVKNTYKKNNADLFGLPWRKGTIFTPAIDYKELKKRWLKSIIKYPYNFIYHRYINFYRKMWMMKFRHPDYKNNKYIKVQKYCASYINGKNCILTLSPIKEKIYDFLDNYLPKIPNFVFSFGCWFLFIVSIVFLIAKKRSGILIFSFVNSLGGCVLSILIPAYAPIAWYRYMHPILYSFLLSFIGLCVFLAGSYNKKKISFSLKMAQKNN